MKSNCELSLLVNLSFISEQLKVYYILNPFLITSPFHWPLLTFSGSNDCKPVILKLKKKQRKKSSCEFKDSSETMAKVRKTENLRLSECCYNADGLRQRRLLCLLGVVIVIMLVRPRGRTDCALVQDSNLQ